MTNEELKIGNNGYQIPLGSGLRKVERNEGEKFDVAGVRFTWKVKGEDILLGNAPAKARRDHFFEFSPPVQRRSDNNSVQPKRAATHNL
jgi:hypothetical protein